MATHIYTESDRVKDFKKCVIEMSSGAMIYIPNFIKTGSAFQEAVGSGYKQTAWQSYKPTITFESGRRGTEIISK
jgi:hypothetical protein